SLRADRRGARGGRARAPVRPARGEPGRGAEGTEGNQADRAGRRRRRIRHARNARAGGEPGVSEATARPQSGTKVYGDPEWGLCVLRDVCLSIRSGELVGIVGASGSGKTTLMNILGCLDRPTRGRYVLDGEDVSTLDDDRLSLLRNRSVGFVF